MPGGIRADVAKCIASLMQGGLASLTIPTLFVIPALYVVWCVVWRRFEGRHMWRKFSTV